MDLDQSFTSTGAKFFHHQDAMTKLRNGRGQPIVTHVMLTDVCNHTCAFCSVQKRAGELLPFEVVTGYLGILIKYGLKAVILSGGGNPILYRDKKSGMDFTEVVNWIHGRDLQIGLITNGMPLTPDYDGVRLSWKTVPPAVLDKLTWVRISMAGLDHPEKQVYVPDVDCMLTTLGFSYVAHDIYDAPEDPHHGKVSTLRDLRLLTRGVDHSALSFEQRITDLTAQFIDYCQRYKPAYLRLLPNCLEPDLIEERCKLLWEVAGEVNEAVGRDVAFVQNKPPSAPRACYLGYVHPVLNCDGYVYPCDSCVLNEAADHQFANPWRMCRWDEVGQLYERPVHSLIDDPARTCPGCVFPKSNELLRHVVEDGTVDLTPRFPVPLHVNFV